MKYIIEFGEQYKYLAPNNAIENADTPKEALLSFLSKRKIYNTVEKVDFSRANVRVKLQGKGPENYYKIIETPIIYKTRPNVVEQSEVFAVRKLIELSVFPIYHGTKDPDLKPSFSFNNYNNDYGKGFYTTPDKELGKEWAYAAYTKGNQGYLYTYDFDLQGLNVLDLTSKDTMHWLAELVTNREINVEGKEALADTIALVKQKYKLNTTKVDVIIGYRADDSYFTYAEDFLSGTIYRDKLETALRYGQLGIQVFIKSKKAFSRLRQVGNPELVPIKYKDYYMKRDAKAKEEYKQIKRNQVSRLKQRITNFI